jgi:hypothetical protein
MDLLLIILKIPNKVERQVDSKKIPITTLLDSISSDGKPVQKGRRNRKHRIIKFLLLQRLSNINK